MPKYSVFVRNLAFDSSRSELRDVFESIGPVKDVHVPLDYYTRRPRGIAYVEFEYEEDAERAITEKDGCEFFGRRIEVCHCNTDRKSSNQMRASDGRRGSYDNRSKHRDRSEYRRRSRSRSRSMDISKPRYHSSRYDAPSERPQQPFKYYPRGRESEYRPREDYHRGSYTSSSSDFSSRDSHDDRRAPPRRYIPQESSYERYDNRESSRGRVANDYVREDRRERSDRDYERRSNRDYDTSNRDYESRHRDYESRSNREHSSENRSSSRNYNQETSRTPEPERAVSRSRSVAHDDRQERSVSRSEREYDQPLEHGATKSSRDYERALSREDY